MTFPFSWASVVWLVWGLMFVANEGHALWKGDYFATLTAHLRWVFGMNGQPADGWLRVRRALLLLFLAWFSAHLVFPPGWF